MDDLEFVRSCITGDKQSWEQFLSKYSRLIYNYIHNVLDAKNISSSNEHVQDIFQEIFASLIKDDFKKLKSFKAKNGCSLASWLRQVTINASIDYLRRLKFSSSLDEENEEGFGLKDALSSDSSNAHQDLSLKENLEELKDCIEQLGTEDKFFLELHINRELKLEELRQVLKLSRGAIDMRKSRLIERLKDCFKSKGLLLDSL